MLCCLMLQNRILLFFCLQVEDGSHPWCVESILQSCIFRRAIELISTNRAPSESSSLQGQEGLGMWEMNFALLLLVF